MRNHITTHSVREAWSVANELFPTDYEYDSFRSGRAGYSVYHSTADGVSAWISDLGNRLEVNLPDGKSVNVWIEEDGEIAEEDMNEAVAEAVGEEIEAERIAEQIEATNTVKQMTVETLFTPEICQRVTICVDGYSWSSEESRKVYEAIKTGHPTICMELVTRYAETHGVKWGGIWGCTAQYYGRDESDQGHYIVSGYISSRIGEEMSFCASCADILNKQSEERRK